VPGVPRRSENSRCLSASFVEIRADGRRLTIPATPRAARSYRSSRSPRRIRSRPGTSSRCRDGCASGLAATGLHLPAEPGKISRCCGSYAAMRSPSIWPTCCLPTCVLPSAYSTTRPVASWPAGRRDSITRRHQADRDHVHADAQMVLAPEAPSLGTSTTRSTHGGAPPLRGMDRGGGARSVFRLLQRWRKRMCHTASATASRRRTDATRPREGLGAGRCRRDGRRRETPAPPPTPAGRGRACLCLTLLSVGAIGCVTRQRPGHPKGERARSSPISPRLPRRRRIEGVRALDSERTISRPTEICGYGWLERADAGDGDDRFTCGVAGG